MSCPIKALDHLVEAADGFVPASRFERDLLGSARHLVSEVRGGAVCASLIGYQASELRAKFRRAVFVMPHKRSHPLFFDLPPRLP